MASKYGSRIEYSGPIFTKDIKATFRKNARDLLSEMASDGASLVQQNLTPGHGRLTGNYAEGVAGRIRSLRGKPWALTSVITSTRHLEMPGYRGYGTFLETGKKGGRQTSFTGYWVFKRVGNAVRRSSRIARADLTKGLN